MKQKMVIRIPMKEKKSHSKALKIVVGASGVESAALKGENKDQIEVTGDAVDVVELTRMLRKKFGHAEIVSVESTDKKKEEKKPDESMVHPASIWPSYVQPNFVYPSYNGYYHNNDPSCIIV